MSNVTQDEYESACDTVRNEAGWDDESSLTLILNFLKAEERCDELFAYLQEVRRDEAEAGDPQMETEA